MHICKDSHDEVWGGGMQDTAQVYSHEPNPHSASIQDRFVLKNNFKFDFLKDALKITYLLLFLFVCFFLI